MVRFAQFHGVFCQTVPLNSVGGSNSDHLCSIALAWSKLYNGGLSNGGLSDGDFWDLFLAT